MILCPHCGQVLDVDDLPSAEVAPFSLEYSNEGSGVEDAPPAKSLRCPCCDKMIDDTVDAETSSAAAADVAGSREGRELLVFRHGQVLEGIAARPKRLIRAAVTTQVLVGIITLDLGVLGGPFGFEPFRRLGLGWSTAALGVLFLVLSYFVSRRRKWALLTAVSLYAFDGILAAWITLLAGVSFITILIFVVVRIGLTVPMVRAMGAMDDLKRQERLEVVRDSVSS